MKKILSLIGKMLSLIGKNVTINWKKIGKKMFRHFIPSYLRVSTIMIIADLIVHVLNHRKHLYLDIWKHFLYHSQSRKEY